MLPGVDLHSWTAGLPAARLLVRLYHITCVTDPTGALQYQRQQTGTNNTQAVIIYLSIDL